MNYITYFIKFFYRIRYWLLFTPFIVALLVFWKTQHMPEQYTTNCSVYTGIITGVSILSESGINTTSYTQSSMKYHYCRPDTQTGFSTFICPYHGVWQSRKR